MQAATGAFHGWSNYADAGVWASVTLAMMFCCNACTRMCLMKQHTRGDDEKCSSHLTGESPEAHGIKWQPPSLNPAEHSSMCGAMQLAVHQNHGMAWHQSHGMAPKGQPCCPCGAMWLQATWHCKA